MRSYNFHTEVIRCQSCKKDYLYPDVYRTWSCPVCGDKLYLKVEIGNFVHAISIFPPSELEDDMTITLDNQFIHQILAITRSGDQYRIALKEYGTITASDPDQIAVIMGGWYD